METLNRLENLRAEVEALWSAINEAPSTEKDALREKYRTAYEAYKRQLTWMKAVSENAAPEL